jgi:hypothetical protein
MAVIVIDFKNLERSSKISKTPLIGNISGF